MAHEFGSGSYSNLRTRARSASPRSAAADREDQPVAARSTREPRLGQKIGPYRLCLEIGSGGMATVYLARREIGDGRGQYVALKCMSTSLRQDPAFVDMFLDEARIASQIRHPNVCSAVDFGVDDGVHFLAMQYLGGETLKAVRDRHAEPDCRIDARWHACVVARVVADAAEGLHAAHELCDASGRRLGVVHRDVSPENIFVTYEGHVALVDFGLVRASTQAHQTRTGIVKGKYGYIQPEALRGQEPDRRCDVWSLGVVLWELLTGQRLFHRESDAATLQAILHLPVTPPSRVAQGIPHELDLVVMQALQREPEQRYQTARDLGRALTRFIADQGQAVGLADLADFMALLFPSGPACKQQLLRVAEQVEDASFALEPSPQPRLHAHMRGEHASTHIQSSDSDRETPTAPRRRSWGKIGLVLAGVAAIAVGVAADRLQLLTVMDRVVATIVDPPSADDDVALEAEPDPTAPAEAARVLEAPEFVAAAEAEDSASHPTAEDVARLPVPESPYTLEVHGRQGDQSRDVVLQLRLVPSDEAFTSRPAKEIDRPPSKPSRRRRRGH